MPSSRKAGSKSANHTFVLQFGHPITAWADKKQTRHLFLMALLTACHEEVHPPNFVGESLINQEIQRAVYGWW